MNIKDKEDTGNDSKSSLKDKVDSTIYIVMTSDLIRLFGLYSGLHPETSLL